MKTGIIFKALSAAGYGMKEAAEFQELLNVTTELKDHLREVHQNEIENNHYGDKSCSYCRTIKKAERILR